MKDGGTTADLGQSLWLDNITRELLANGTLQRYIREYSVTGLTSNPTIFDNAIKKGDFYDAAIRQKNDDIANMAKMGFGNDVIEAKIQQASAVDFKLEVNDLSRLKSAGVSQHVISAMLKRSSAPAEGPKAAQAPPMSMPPMVAGASGMPTFSTSARSSLLRRIMARSNCGPLAEV